MKICLYGPPADAGSPDLEAYVAQLAGVLAGDHQVTRLSSLPALRGLLLRDRPDVLHLHQSSLVSLFRLLDSARAGQVGGVPVALTLHDYRLRCTATDLRHPDGRGCAPRLACRVFSAINRLIADPVGLVHSPSQYALDRHLEQGFFRESTRLVLAYGLGAGPSTPDSSESTRPFAVTDCVVVTARSPINALLAIHRAFQAGSIVIASRIGGVPEIVRDGVNGLLVEPGDDQAVANALERLRRSPELVQRLRTGSRQAAQLYNMTFHAAHLVGAYAELIAAHRAGPLFRNAA
ncbi:MAG: glycosyltransferase [Candidatus Dormibacteraeota bacterium]|nr:glycosyltransferase [Candidatus Dormibacteraeota bacterium]